MLATAVRSCHLYAICVKKTGRQRGVEGDSLFILEIQTQRDDGTWCVLVAPHELTLARLDRHQILSVEVSAHGLLGEICDRILKKTAVLRRSL